MSKFWQSFVKRADASEPLVAEKPQGVFDVYVRQISKEAGAFYFSWSPSGKIDGRIRAEGIDESHLGKVASVQGTKDRRKLLKAKLLRLPK